MTPMELALYIFEMTLVGIGVGLISGALGLGGGILMVPAFVTFQAGMDVHTAKGTSLFIIIFVSLLNAWRHNRGLPDKPWRLAAYLAAGSIVGSYLGAWVTTMVTETMVIGVFMVLLGILAFRTFLLTPREVHEDEVRKRRVITVLIGLTAGFFGGATGTGGGAVLIPLALMAGIMTNDRAVGLSNMVMVATSFAGTLAHLRAEEIYVHAWTYGHVYLGLVPLVFIGSQIGSPLGKNLNHHLTLPRRRVLMGGLLLIIAVRLLWRLTA